MIIQISTAELKLIIKSAIKEALREVMLQEKKFEMPKITIKGSDLVTTFKRGNRN